MCGFQPENIICPLGIVVVLAILAWRAGPDIVKAMIKFFNQ